MTEKPFSDSNTADYKTRRCGSTITYFRQRYHLPEGTTYKAYKRKYIEYYSLFSFIKYKLSKIKIIALISLLARWRFCFE